MKRFLSLMLATALMSQVTVAKASSEAELEVGTDATVDTTETFDLEHDGDFHKDKYFYKCVAIPYQQHGGGHHYFGDGWSIYDAKQEALKRCYHSTHKRCYIKKCQKYKK